MFWCPNRCLRTFLPRFLLTFRGCVQVLPGTYSGSTFLVNFTGFCGLSCPSRPAFSSDFIKVHFLTTSVTFYCFRPFLSLDRVCSVTWLLGYLVAGRSFSELGLLRVVVLGPGSILVCSDTLYVLVQSLSRLVSWYTVKFLASMHCVHRGPLDLSLPGTFAL